MIIIPCTQRDSCPRAFDSSAGFSGKCCSPHLEPFLIFRYFSGIQVFQVIFLWNPFSLCKDSAIWSWFVNRIILRTNLSSSNMGGGGWITCPYEPICHCSWAHYASGQPAATTAGASHSDLTRRSNWVDPSWFPLEKLKIYTHSINYKLTRIRHFFILKNSKLFVVIFFSLNDTPGIFFCHESNFFWLLNIVNKLLNSVVLEIMLQGQYQNDIFNHAYLTFSECIYVPACNISLAIRWASFFGEEELSSCLFCVERGNKWQGVFQSWAGGKQIFQDTGTQIPCFNRVENPPVDGGQIFWWNKSWKS